MYTLKSNGTFDVDTEVRIIGGGTAGTVAGARAHDRVFEIRNAGAVPVYLHRISANVTDLEDLVSATKHTRVLSPGHALDIFVPKDSELICVAGAEVTLDLVVMIVQGREHSAPFALERRPADDKYRVAVPVTPDDANDIAGGPYDGFVLGTGGAIKITRGDGTEVTLTLPAGYHPISVTRIWAAGLSASGITAVRI